MRTEPARSVPMASAPHPLASAAPAPPDEPPGVCSRFHGLRVVPQKRVVGNRLGPAFGHVGDAEHDAAGFLEPGHDRGVFARHVVFEHVRAPGDALPRHVDHVLDGEGNTVQEAQRIAVADRRLGGLGFGAGGFGADDGEGVDVGLHGLDAGQ